MKRAERLQAVLDLLAERGNIDVDDIVSGLEVSPATARRDLDTLAEQQLLTRTRGGATSQSVAYDLPLRYKRGRHAAEKQRIARAACELVSAGTVVGLCGGTTSTAIADALGGRADLMRPAPEPSVTIVTNAINIAAQLAMRPQIKTVVTGGVVHPRSYELVGPYSDIVLGRITIDIAFVGVNGIDPEYGPTVHDEAEASINSLLARRAERAILVADSSKVGHRSFATLDPECGFELLITDDGISAAQRAAFERRGIEVLVA